MPDVLYVGLQDDDKIVSFGIDAGSGKLVPSGETPAAGAPSVFALSPDRRVLYVGYRGTPAIVTPLDIYTVGRRPAAVLAVPLGR
jgi:6-phosphogluconolactonase (cycloisomerase 2 family)